MVCERQETFDMFAGTGGDKDSCGRKEDEKSGNNCHPGNISLSPAFLVKEEKMANICSNSLFETKKIMRNRLVVGRRSAIYGTPLFQKKKFFLPLFA